MAAITLFHRTDQAEAILADGFQDSECIIAQHLRMSGVFLSDRPLDCNEGAKGAQLLQVTLDLSQLDDFEIVEEGKPYREWIVPAELISRYGKVELVS